METPHLDGTGHIEEVHTGPPDFSELAVRLVARMTEDPEPDHEDAPQAAPVAAPTARRDS
jgi:hypothetical protein